MMGTTLEGDAGPDFSGGRAPHPKLLLIPSSSPPYTIARTLKIISENEKALGPICSILDQRFSSVVRSALAGIVVRH